jgi:hypothetical protein
LDELTREQQQAALQAIIYLYTGATLFAALLVFLYIPTHGVGTRVSSFGGSVYQRWRSVMSTPVIWPQLVIVVSAYVAYKGIDNYVLYAVQGYQLTEVEGSRVAAISGWLRPISAIVAGFLADRVRASRVVLGAFLLLLAGYSLFATLQPAPGLYWLLLGNVAVTSIAVYALHAIYFALVAESSIPLGVTGTAVGIISVIGFTPDIFFGPAMGWLLDNHDIVQGHQLVFTGLLAFAGLGGVASLLLLRQLRAAGATGRVKAKH